MENRVDAIRGTLRRAITELFGSDRPALSLLAEATLAARIAERVCSQFSIPSHSPGGHYIRERDAARYMGISVATLRSWRLRRSNNGPPFTRIGRMVMYPMAGLENHMQERQVPPRERERGRSAKAQSHNADTHALEESDRTILSMNQTNKEERSSTEPGEKRVRAKENIVQPNTSPDTERRTSVPGIGRCARSSKEKEARTVHSFCFTM
jgi:hypothetical protein